MAASVAAVVAAAAFTAAAAAATAAISFSDAVAAESLNAGRGTVGFGADS